MAISIKRSICDAVAAYLGTQIASLSGKISSLQEGPESITTWPSVALLPSTFTFEPSDPLEVYWNKTEDDKQVVVDVGEFDGTIELQLYTNTRAMREQYEQVILDLFLSQEGSPGTIFVPTLPLIVNGYQSLYTPHIKVRLDTEDWREEFSFDTRRYMFLDLSLAFPALTTYTAATLTDLQIAIVGTLNSDTPDETVEINQDGSISPPP